MHKLIQDKYVLAYSGLYLLSLLGLLAIERFPVEEAIAITVIFAVILPLIAYGLSRSSVVLSPAKPAIAGEMLALGFSLLIILLFLAIGSDVINSSLGITEEYPRAVMISNLVQKLLIFVLIPFLIFSRQFGLNLRDFGLSVSCGEWLQNKHLRVLVSLSGFMILFQLFVGQAAAPVRDGEFSALQLLVGLPLVFAWLIFEVGLVEEFFFRAVVQSRVTARFNSESAGIVISAVLFGLAHAPGLILRGAGENSPVGTDPSVLMALCYSIVVLSGAGLFLGIVWSRTRNLWLVMIIHAAVDLLPNYAQFVRVWGIN